MASSVLNAPPTFSTPTPYRSINTFAKTSRVSFAPNRLPIIRSSYSNNSNRKYNYNRVKVPTRFNKLLTFAANEEVKIEEQEKDTVQDSDSDSEPEIELNTDGAIDVDASDEGDEAVAEEPNSVIVSSISLYKEAVANGDEEKVTELESFFKSIEDEKINLEKKVAALSDELSSEKTRILRISADFDNFRKRTERERISLVTNAQGEVVESLLPVVDNFERAKAQLKIETEGEEKVNNSYQSIYKQFFEILGSLGVIPVETVGKPFDPMMHEAIMREDSSEYEDGIVIEEYRKGFQLGERLLRPSMVKVSAGPGPAKSEPEVQEEANEAGGTEATPAEATPAEATSAEE